MSNTGCVSVGELVMTCRISLVAVCCSSDSRELGRALLDLLLEVALRILQPRGGVVELLGERLELVAGADVDAVIELALADARGALLQQADRRDHPAGQRDARQHREQQAQRQHDDAARRRGAQRGEGVLDRAAR